MRVAIIDYDAGNLTSVARAVAGVGQSAIVTRDPAVIAGADRVIFPGVGAAASCMASFRALGMDQALLDVVRRDRPVLCICVGLQLLFGSSEEDGGTPCLGLLEGAVVRFRPTDAACKVPHMGWNATRLDDEALSQGIAPESHFYYVHSYHVAPGAGVQVIASADHGGRFCAGVRRGNLAAVQFHPEKSGAVGLRLLGNFLAA